MHTAFILYIVSKRFFMSFYEKSLNQINQSRIYPVGEKIPKKDSDNLIKELTDSFIFSINSIKVKTI